MLNIDLSHEATLLRGKRVLVTGADGFIGSHLVEALVKAGVETRAFVLYNSFNSWGWLDTAAPEIRANLDVFPGDVRDHGGVRAAMQGCDVVLHLAALISIPFSYHSPEAFVDTNVKGTLNVVQAARDLGVSRVVVTSTSEVYGTARFVPITESHPLQGQSPYSATKIGGDHVALSYHMAFGTPVVVLRPFNTYGPRQSARAVIPTIATQLSAGMRRIKLGALHPTRDFSFVADTVRGFARAAVSEGIEGEVINIGSGFEISVGDTAKLIAETMNVEVEFETDAQRLRPAASEVERLFAGIEKAEKLMGWTPLYGGRDGFKRGIAETVAWFSDSANLARYKADRYNI
ncbi:MAG TPA: NAD-dependent 4,6-dehydratase LegB [Xanthobacteraceae bacterium]|nr:NAD-dependent 4,6-dehydratase LegB [Xanthobacteraceae bacterium]